MQATQDIEMTPLGQFDKGFKNEIVETQCGGRYFCCLKKKETQIQEETAPVQDPFLQPKKSQKLSLAKLAKKTGNCCFSAIEFCSPPCCKYPPDRFEHCGKHSAQALEAALFCIPFWAPGLGLLIGCPGSRKAVQWGVSFVGVGCTCTGLICINMICRNCLCPCFCGDDS